MKCHQQQLMVVATHNDEKDKITCNVLPATKRAAWPETGVMSEHELGDAMIPDTESMSKRAHAGSHGMCSYHCRP